MENSDSEYQLQVEEVEKKTESFSDNDSLTATDLVFNPARNKTLSRKNSLFELQMTSKDDVLPEENTFNWMFMRTQSTKQLVKNKTDFNQADFSMLKVGKHILQLPQLHSSSQDYRLNKNIKNTMSSAKQQDTNTKQQSYSVGNDSDDILTGNI